MIVSSPRLAWFGAALLIVSCAVGLIAQGRGEATDTGSLAALTAEVRQLRLAVEDSTRTQAQTQAPGVYLSAQQSRLVQVASRLDVARKELDGVTIRSREIAAGLSAMNESLLRETKPEAREALEREIRGLKLELENTNLQDQQARSRVAELSQILQTEDARWADLISRLEQLIRR